MIIIPYKVDVPSDRIPVTNWVLAFSLVLVFVFQFIEEINTPFEMEIIEPNSGQASVDSNTSVVVIESNDLPDIPEEWGDLDDMPDFRFTRPARVADRFVLRGWNLRGMVGAHVAPRGNNPPDWKSDIPVGVWKCNLHQTQ